MHEYLYIWEKKCSRGTSHNFVLPPETSHMLILAVRVHCTTGTDCRTAELQKLPQNLLTLGKLKKTKTTNKEVSVLCVRDVKHLDCKRTVLEWRLSVTNTPGVAGAVLQTPSSFIGYLIKVTVTQIICYHNKFAVGEYVHVHSVFWKVWSVKCSQITKFKLKIHGLEPQTNLCY